MGWSSSNKITVSALAAFAAASSLAAPAQADDQADRFAELLQQKYNITIKPDIADDIARTTCAGPLYGVGYYNTQQAIEQRYPKNNRALIPTIMSAAVLAYCPGRLP